MRLLAPLVMVSALASCAFPGPGLAGQAAVGSDGMLFLAYQADGVRDGQPATVSRTLVNFGAPIANAERIDVGACVGFRAKSAPGVVFPSRDAGELRIAGATGDYRCREKGGTYDCNLPESGGFFEDGARLSLKTTGGADFAAFASGNVSPPRAPRPDIDLASLASGSAVKVTWEPSETPVPMTCLQLETLSSEGFVNGFVQCDVNDADGVAVVPAEVAAMLDRSAPVTRAALFSVDGSEVMDREGLVRAVYFGRGRFSEVHRTP